MPATQKHTSPKKILILTSTAGGGHKSAASALTEQLNHIYGHAVTVESVDVLKEYAPQPFDRTPEAYQMMIKSPTAWRGFYELGDGARRSRLIMSSISLYARRRSERLLTNHPADIIISTYHFANSPILESLSRTHSTVPFITVVTDLVTAPPVWFDPRTTLCITPTEDTAELARKMAIPEEKIKVIGMPVSSRFKPAASSKVTLKSDLGLSSKRPLVVVIAGGEGIAPFDQIVDNFAGINATIMIITGKNAGMLSKLESKDLPDNYVIKGFVDNLPEIMQAADVIITKAGPGTIMEALNCHLPLILFSKLPGQEDGNVDFVTIHGAGLWQPKLSQLGGDLRSLLASPSRLSDMQAAAAKISQPDATRNIVLAIGRQVGLTQPSH